VLQQVEPLVASASEPQWIGVFGALLGDLRRRRRELPAARAAVADALDRLEVCTDDVARIARVSAIGARIEADIAQRARDLKEKAEERDAVARARLHVGRLRAAASEGGPVERAWREMGAAELTRARGRSDAKQWLKAAAEWDAIARPYPGSTARWRAAEALVEKGDRTAAAQVLTEALQRARRLESAWLIRETTALAERARLGLGEAAVAGGDGAGAEVNGDGHATGRPARPEEDPFELTPRERQVLALLAVGASNRQFGAALYMAEKTASVHVSRILRKLGVQSRTQAAALAHRMRLAY
jgi:DNA-binding CsgD family transcriptional regulator